MRIIAGKYRSRQIDFIKKSTIRPTKDNIRENVFNMIEQDRIDNCLVLDLFCGSGAYGFESLSRGASCVYFNDSVYEITNLVKTNANRLDCLNNIVVLNKSWEKAINHFHKQNLKFDLIFIDPPYYKNYYNAVLENILGITNDNGLIIIESTKNITYTIPPEFEIIKDKQYQDQIIRFIKKRS